jgi:hypothetical protein
MWPIIVRSPREDGSPFMATVDWLFWLLLVREEPQSVAPVYSREFQMRWNQLKGRITPILKKLEEKESTSIPASMTTNYPSIN